MSYLLIAASSSDLLPEPKQVDRSFIQLRDLMDRVTLLAVEFVELLQIVEICSGLAFHAVQLLNPGLETEELAVWMPDGSELVGLDRFAFLFPRTFSSPCPSIATAEKGFGRHTSVSKANVGFHPSGGMILHIPAFSASARMLSMNLSGSVNSSAVG